MENEFNEITIPRLLQRAGRKIIIQQGNCQSDREDVCAVLKVDRVRRTA